MSPRRPTLPRPEGCICRDPSCLIPYGYCHCRCGGLTTIAILTHCPGGAWAGMPHRYITGHQARSPRPEIMQPSDEAIRFIALTQGKVARVSAKNYESLMQMLWFAWKNIDTGQFYARTNLPDRLGGTCILMHCLILSAPKGKLVDHIDRDTLNNIESNLRVSTTSQNNMNHKKYCTNTSGATGINLAAGKYRASIRYNYETIHIGYFDQFVDAVQARRAKEIELFGEFARVDRDGEEDDSFNSP